MSDNWRRDVQKTGVWKLWILGWGFWVPHELYGNLQDLGSRERCNWMWNLITTSITLKVELQGPGLVLGQGLLIWGLQITDFKWLSDLHPQKVLVQNYILLCCFSLGKRYMASAKFLNIFDSIRGPVSWGVHSGSLHMGCLGEWWLGSNDFNEYLLRVSYGPGTVLGFFWDTLRSKTDTYDSHLET